MKYLITFVLLISALWAGNVNAVNCPATGTISTDCSWELSGSPVSLGAVTISAGVTATVESDVVLQLLNEDMDIYGTLDVNNGALIIATGNQNVSDIRVYSGGIFNLSSPATVTHAGSGRINVDVYGSAVLTGASLDVNTFSAYSGAACNISATTINAGKIAFYKGSDYTLSGNTLRGGVYPDTDGDGIPDDGDRSGVIGDNRCTGGTASGCDDNCIKTPNSGQQDTNGDGYGNMCDADLDNDGVVGFQDYNIFKAAWLSDPSKPTWNADSDFDSDGVIGFQDFNIFKGRWLTSAPW